MGDVAIVASNSLDEYIISDLWDQGAQVDQFGVGEALITSRSNPVFGGVYKIAATVQDGEYTAKIKVSESIEKITTPCFKTLYRLYSNETGKAIADYIALYDEEIDESRPLTIFDPIATWKKQELTDYTARRLLWSRLSAGGAGLPVPAAAGRSRPTAGSRWTPCGTR